jgi:hypothetical protein
LPAQSFGPAEFGLLVKSAQGKFDTAGATYHCKIKKGKEAREKEQK